MLYSISYGFKSDFLDKEIKCKYILSLYGEYKESNSNSLLFYKTDLSFEKLYELMNNNFDSKSDCFVLSIMEKGKYKCINEDEKVFKWMWEQ